ncbi:MAG: response regulator [archaeon]
MTKTIMVVDDEPDTIELTKAILEMNGGFEPITFTRAKEALEALKNKSMPDLLVLDMRMPEISGPNFCAELRKSKKFDKLKIVFFTASSDMDNNLLKKYNILGFIFKPFDNEELIKQINGYLKK